MARLTVTEDAPAAADVVVDGGAHPLRNCSFVQPVLLCLIASEIGRQS